MAEHFSLQQLRERQEWTQAKLAEIAGVEIQTIEDIEAGKPVDWTIAASITAKIRNYIGTQAVEGLTIPQNRS